MGKFVILLFFASVFTSCVSTQLSADNNFDYSVLRVNSKYSIETNNGEKIRAFQFIKQDNLQLVGTIEEKNINIEKANINKIQKFSAGKTVPLILGAVVAAILVPAFAKNKPVGQ